MLNIVSVASSVSNWSGGIGPIMRNHAYWLLKKGHKSRTVSLFDDHSVDAYSSWNGLNLKLVKPQISSFGFGLGMRDLIQNADLLHQHGTWQYSSVLAARWTKSTKRPLVISTQGMLEPWALNNSRLKKKVALRVFQRENLESAACIHCSEGEIEGVRSLGLNNPIAVIPNGVDLPALHKSGVDYDHSIKRPFNFLFLGRISIKKGVVELVQAFDLLRSRRPDLYSKVSLDIYGWDDGALDILKKLIFDLSLQDKVNYRGSVFGEAKTSALMNSDIFTLPSYSEGFPLAILESWAHGVPVIYTRRCNIDSGFDAGCGFECTPSPESICNAMVNVLENDKLSDSSKAARNLVLRKYQWESVVDELISVYAWLTGNGVRPSCVETV